MSENYPSSGTGGNSLFCTFLVPTLGYKYKIVAVLINQNVTTVGPNYLYIHTNRHKYNTDFVYLYKFIIWESVPD